MSRVLCRNLSKFLRTREIRDKRFLLVVKTVNKNLANLYAQNNNLPKEFVRYDNFVSVQKKTKKSYLEMIDIFMARDKNRSGHVEFIYSALKHMKDFGVHKDLEVYKKLIDVFPKGKMIPKNIIQAEFMHYPKHQQCAIDLLEQMEENGVIPDWEMQDQLLNVFGNRGYPLRRYWRMMYWMPKFRKASPWPLPLELPNDTLELAKLAIERITDVDPTYEITVHKTKDIEASLEDTWIVSGQSSIQRDFIHSLPSGRTLYVSTGLRVWLRDKAVTYFTLTTDPIWTYNEDYDVDDVTHLLDRKLTRKRTVHEGDEEVILGVASSGTSSADSMLSWIRVLTGTSPRLADLQVLFRTTQPSKEDDPVIPAPQERLDSS